MPRKTKKPAKPSADAIKRGELTQKWWATYHTLYSQVNELGAYMQSMQDGMENLRNLTQALEVLADKDETKPAAKTKKSK